MYVIEWKVAAVGAAGKVRIRYTEGKTSTSSHAIRNAVYNILALWAWQDYRLSRLTIEFATTSQHVELKLHIDPCMIMTNSFLL